jgi:hypothetical protein
MNNDADKAKGKMPQVMEWLGAYTPAPSIITMNGAYKEG